MSERRQRPALTAIQALTGGQVVPRHWHDQNQIVYASQGVLSVETEAGVWVTPAHRAIWVPAGVLHQHRSYGRTDLLTVAVPEAIEMPSHPTVLAVNPLLRELLLAYAQPPHTEGPTRGHMLTLLVDLLAPAPDRALHLPTPRDPRLVEAQRLIMDEPSTLTEVAARVGASPRHLTRLCREELGLSFVHWRTQLRLHHALQLLAHGESVTTVALRCGWATPSAFIDVFRRQLGFTPGRRSAPNPPDVTQGTP